MTNPNDPNRAQQQQLKVDQDEEEQMRDPLEDMLLELLDTQKNLEAINGYIIRLEMENEGWREKFAELSTQLEEEKHRSLLTEALLIKFRREFSEHSNSFETATEPGSQQREAEIAKLNSTIYYLAADVGRKDRMLRQQYRELEQLKSTFQKMGEDNPELKATTEHLQEENSGLEIAIEQFQVLKVEETQPNGKAQVLQREMAQMEQILGDLDDSTAQLRLQFQAQERSKSETDIERLKSSFETELDNSRACLSNPTRTTARKYRDRLKTSAQ